MQWLREHAIEYMYFTGCVHSLARNRGNEEGVMVMDSLNSGFLINGIFAK